MITHIEPNSFRNNLKMQFMTLSHNKITVVEHLSHLENLQALDLSHNSIEEVSLERLPPNLMSLKLNGNPIEQRAVDSN